MTGREYGASWQRLIWLILVGALSAVLAAGLLSGAAMCAQSRLDGLWDATVTVGQAEVPFSFEIASASGQVQGFFFEGSKKIGSTTGSFASNHLQLQYEFLNSTLTATLEGEELAGTYRYNRRNGREYPFRARRSQGTSADSAPHPSVAGNWEMKLASKENSTTTKDSRTALSWKLFLRQSEHEVSGSILRIDGDTGTLTGGWHGDTLVLSHFAGERPVLFEATLQPDGTLDVTYNRFNKYLAARTTEARAKGIPEPPDPTRFSSVKEADKPFAFQFPDVEGNLVSSSDARFRGKVVLLAIGGTWCPNCRDEAPFLVELYRRYHAQGLEIVGLNFEASGDPAEDRPRVVSYVKEFFIPFPVLLAGVVGEVPEKLPQLVGFGAYPTTIFLGRDGRVRAIHAGFASAATGEASAELAQETRARIERLLAETSTAAAKP